MLGITDESSRLLRQILFPAEAQSLVLPPANRPPASGPGESTPLTGSLAKAPSQATRAGSVLRGSQTARRVLWSGADSQGISPPHPLYPPTEGGDPQYIKVSSKGQVGYLPKANLLAAQQIDGNLKVLDEAEGKCTV